jgi:hypothetical protein
MFALAISIVSSAGCDVGSPPREAANAAQDRQPIQPPSGRYEIDPGRDRVWLLTHEGAFVYDLSRPERIALSLPGWLLVDPFYGCLPDLALGPRGEAVITSNTLPTLWRVDPDTLAVSVHPLALDADTDKDVLRARLLAAARRIPRSELRARLALADRPAPQDRTEDCAFRTDTRGVWARRAASRFPARARSADRLVRAYAARRLVHRLRGGWALSLRERRAVRDSSLAAGGHRQSGSRHQALRGD